jgi:Spy/CpxP family protein refolding chaperone
MKKAIAIAVLSIIVAAPALADNVAATPSVKKTAPVAPSGNMHGHMDMKNGCSDTHGMGHGYGMMGEQGADMMMEPNMHLLGALSLSKDQQAKINQLSDELKHNNWTTLGLINDETAKLRDLYEADKRDPAAIGKEYQKVFDLKRQMIEAYLNSQNRIEEILTPEQLAKLKSARQEAHHMYRHTMH